MKIKTVLYWLSVVRPIADIVIGAVKGVIGAIQQIRSDEQLANEREMFEKAQSMPFLSDLKGDNKDGQ